jgi:hypothetical protein
MPNPEPPSVLTVQGARAELFEAKHLLRKRFSAEERARRSAAWNVEASAVVGQGLGQDIVDCRVRKGSGHAAFEGAFVRFGLTAEKLFGVCATQVPSAM